MRPGVSWEADGVRGSTPWPGIHGEGQHRASHSLTSVGQGTQGNPSWYGNSGTPGGDEPVAEVGELQRPTGPGAAPGCCVHPL